MELMDFKGSFVIIFIILYQSWNTETKSLPSLDAASGLHSYMKSYGYVEDGTTMTANSNRDALIKYQRFFYLPETGILDERTRKLMEQTRCGEPDINSVAFALAPKYYGIKNIRWKINQTDRINFLDAKKLLSESVQEWQSWMVRLTVTEASSESDRALAEIIINFVRPDVHGQHGDGIPFTDNALAHAFYPDKYAISSDIHVNMAYSYTLQEPPLPPEHSLKWVIMHELGHALGLKHSRRTTAIMYPIIPAGVPYPRLSLDDIYGIRTLYGVCMGLPCQNGGTCLPLVRPPGSVCKCPPTHHGLLCEKECTNARIECDQWAGRGECLVTEEFMQLYCYKSCNRCNIRKCVNYHPVDRECKDWANKGACTSNSAWMDSYCYKECSKCNSLGCPSKSIIP